MQKILNQTPDYYKPYVQAVFDEMDLDSPSVNDALAYTYEQLLDLIPSIYEEQKDFAYGADKWSIIEVFGHMIDTERIFSTRAMRIARGEKKNQEGFDQNEFASNANYRNRSLESVKQEFYAVMDASGHLWENIAEEDEDNSGMASNQPVTPKVIGYIAAGHRLHHTKMIKEIYLAK